MAFPPPHIVEPQLEHTHTVFLLHGRSSNGPEFAEDLFSSKCSAGKDLPAMFPTVRWVFPTAKHRWSESFKEDLCAWFDISSVADPNEKQELQLEGLRESTAYILDLVDREIEVLGGKPYKVALGGMSQGMATALWAMLCSPGRLREKACLGGFVGMCGWLPFTNEMEEEMAKWAEDDGPRMAISTILNVFKRIQDGHRASMMDIGCMLQGRVLLVHGTDDAWVNVEHGRRAYRDLTALNLRVEWQENSGAENGGHWVKEPEGFDAIVRFLGSELLGWKDEEIEAALTLEAPNP